jgi:hypothetical protein
VLSSVLVSIFANEVIDMGTSVFVPGPWDSFSAMGRGKVDSDLLATAWRRSVQNLIVETDVEKMLPLLYAAETDLWNRWEDMADVVAHDAERIALNAAAVKIYAIKTQVLGWPAL